MLSVGFQYINLLFLLSVNSPLLVNQGEVYLKIPIKSINNNYVFKRLYSGVQQKIIIRLKIKQKGKDKPIITYYSMCEISYDLWDENFISKCNFMGKNKKRIFKQQNKLINYISFLGYNPICKGYVLHKQQKYRLEIKIDFNPISKKTLKLIRYWLIEEQNKNPPNVIGRFMGTILKIKSWKSERSWVEKSPWFIWSEK